MKRKKYTIRRSGEYEFSPFEIDWFKSQYKGKSTTIDISKVRYAKGEISKEEFDKMKEDII